MYSSNYEYQCNQSWPLCGQCRGTQLQSEAGRAQCWDARPRRLAVHRLAHWLSPAGAAGCARWRHRQQR